LSEPVWRSNNRQKNTNQPHKNNTMAGKIK
jgi:hypothetical protein